MTQINTTIYQSKPMCNEIRLKWNKHLTTSNQNHKKRCIYEVFLFKSLPKEERNVLNNFSYWSSLCSSIFNKLVCKHFDSF